MYILVRPCHAMHATTNRYYDCLTITAPVTQRVTSPASLQTLVRMFQATGSGAVHFIVVSPT